MKHGGHAVHEEDPLDGSRGVLKGAVIGAVIWFAICAAVGFAFW